MKFDKNWIVKSYMKLPLAGKVIVPFAAIFLISALLKSISTALTLGLVGLAVYVILRAVDKIGSKK